MITQRRILLCGLILGGLGLPFFAGGCGQNSTSKVQTQAPIGSIQIHGAVPQDQRDRLAHAIDYLKENADTLNTQALLALGLEPDQTISDWLNTRVHYIVPSQYNLRANVFEARLTFNYENPQLFPVIEKGSEEPQGRLTRAPGQGSQILMSNVGAAVYEAGKRHGALLGLRISGVGDIPIPTPRVGVVQLGQNLFPKSPLQDSASLDIFLLGILFHEARHSDGNGVSAGFFHAVCPVGHDFAGLAACDRNTNGPYTVEAGLDNELIRTCTTCSAKNLEVLRVMYYDSLDRVLPSTQPWDARPEGHL